MSQDPKANWKSVLEFVPELMKRTGIPGVEVGVWCGGEEFAAGFGVTNVDHPLPVTDTTLFQIGSNTKTFTGTAIMRLVDQGKIALADKVRKYIPDFAVADESISASVTVRHLLNHMSGWDGDMFVDTGEGDDAVAKYVARLQGRRQLVPMDAIWTYNNSGFSMLGRILELVGGKTYEAMMKELVFAPLGLENTFLDPSDVMTHRFAVGHNPGPEGPSVAKPWALPRGIGPAGRICSNVHDMLQYARFHLGDGTGPKGEQLLSRELLRQMQTPEVTVFRKEKWGLAWAVDDTIDARRVWHGGGTVGQISNLSLFPEHQLAFCILTNSYAGRVFNPKMVAFLIQQYLGLDVPESKPTKADPKKLAELLGRYDNVNGEVEIGMVAGQLAVVMTARTAFPNESVPVPPPTPPSPVLYSADDLLLMPPASDPVHVIRRPDGSVGWLRAGYRVFSRIS